MANRPTIAEVENVSSVEEAILIQAKIEPLVQIPIDVNNVDEEATMEKKLGKEKGGTRRRKVLALDIAYSTKSDLVVASGVLYDPSRSGFTASSSNSKGKQGSKVNTIDPSILAEKVSSGRVKFPYHPGLLAFREIPLLTSILSDLLPSSTSRDDDDEGIGATAAADDDDEDVVILCDGAGLAHPRFCGLACHLGVLYQHPSIGVAKNHLIGEYDESRLGLQRGSQSLLHIGDRPVGTVLRSQTDIRPIFVSPGHLFSIQEANEVVLELCRKYRLPEPLRRADHIGRLELKRLEQEQEGQQCKAR